MNKSELIKKIKQKKELSDIPDCILNELLQKQIRKNNFHYERLKHSEVKTLIKSTRAILRRYTGRFQASSKKRINLLEKNKIIELLKTHSSTRDRLEFYPELKKLFNKLKINSVLDLGCGLNPIALATPKLLYYASDIKSSELDLIKIFFKKNKIKGKIFLHDLRKTNAKLPKADICLLFNVLDVVETKGHKLAEKIILSLNCKYILISFSTKTLSGKPMRHPQRGWIERLLNRLNYKFKIIKSGKEIFYLIFDTPPTLADGS